MANRKEIRLGNIFGVTVALDPSWIIIFILVTWNLSSGVFAPVHPEWGVIQQWLVSVIAAFLFFASILAHELAHSLTAKTRGIPVNKIVLFLFGGVSDIEKEPDTPLSEFFIAAVGPLTSFIIGILSLWLGIRLGEDLRNAMAAPGQFFALLSPARTVLVWLGTVNILVGIFNLVPGFPLDGGRIFRSFLWSLTGNLNLSTTIASALGQGIGWLIMALGFATVLGISVPYLERSLLGGIWLILIGWFLAGAAAMAKRKQSRQ